MGPTILNWKVKTAKTIMSNAWHVRLDNYPQIPDGIRTMESNEQDMLIPQQDVIKIVQLLGRIAGMKADLTVRRREFMIGLADMVQADAWLWSATRVIEDQKRPVSVGFIYEGLSDQACSGLIQSSQSTNPRSPEDTVLSDIFAQGHHFTRTRQQIVSDEVWYSNSMVQQYRLDNGIDHFLYSIYPLDNACCSAIGFFRKVGQPPFTDLQRRICHILVSNIDWIHYTIFPEHKGEACTEVLTPRQRAILLHLLDGKQRDDIAKLLHISPQTVKTHMRNIYQQFSVNSQIELMRHFQAGNGYDQSNKV